MLRANIRHERRRHSSTETELWARTQNMSNDWKILVRFIGNSISFFFALSLFFSGFLFTQLILSLTIILSFRFSFESVQYTRETVIFMCWWWTRWPRNTHTNNRWVSTGDIFIERQFIYQLMADKMLVRCRMFVRIVFNLKIELSAKKVAIGALHLALLCVSWLD